MEEYECGILIRAREAAEEEYMRILADQDRQIAEKDRQIEILTLACEGFSDDEIALQTHMDIEEVRSVTSRIKRRPPLCNLEMDGH